ncbi:hypothetical protein LINGRAHAP2_LOCUS16860 [Linum grandiflorum]
MKRWREPASCQEDGSTSGSLTPTLLSSSRVAGRKRKGSRASRPPLPRGCNCKQYLFFWTHSPSHCSIVRQKKSSTSCCHPLQLGPTTTMVGDHPLLRLCL